MMKQFEENEPNYDPVKQSPSKLSKNKKKKKTNKTSKIVEQHVEIEPQQMIEKMNIGLDSDDDDDKWDFPDVHISGVNKSKNLL